MPTKPLANQSFCLIIDARRKLHTLHPRNAIHHPVPPAEPTTSNSPDTPGPDEPDSNPSDADEPGSTLQVQVIAHTDISDQSIDDWLRQHVQHGLRLCGVTHAQLNLVIVADEEMAELHEQYTGVAGTTDVLTFDMAEDHHVDSPAAAPTLVEADIILCLDEARRQAKERGHETRVELLLYAIHGLLHLLGEDDHDEDDYQRMHAREDELLQQMGFGRIFHT